MALRWEEAVCLHSQKHTDTSPHANEQRIKNLQLAGAVSFWRRFRETNECRSSACLWILFDVSLYLVLMRHSNKEKQPNCFDFIIIVVGGPFTSFSCQRRENTHTSYSSINTTTEVLWYKLRKSQSDWQEKDRKDGESRKKEKQRKIENKRDGNDAEEEMKLGGNGKTWGNKGKN